ncbi:MAG: efflux RND transporter periplasmic adaptor subunit, partial [Candidatus Eiseniibacteriota bacterium]
APGGKPGGFAMAVEAKPVRVATATQDVAAIGTLRSFESVVIRPEVAGRIAVLDVPEGQPVNKGQVLVKLDGSVQQAELDQALAALALARANFQRADSLQKRGVGTPQAVDQARATLLTDEAAVELARAKLDKMEIRAPFAGVAGLRKVSIGDYLAPGTDIVNLEVIDRLKVDFRVPELLLASVRPGQNLTILVDAFAGRSFAGVVYAVDPLVDAAGRSILLRATIDNPDGMLRPGLFARVALVVESRPNAIFVPEAALVPVGANHFVFRIVDGKAAMTKIRIGPRTAGEVEVVEGLSPKDVVVTAGVLKIRDGMPVRVVGPGGGAGAPGGPGGPGGKPAAPSGT